MFLTYLPTSQKAPRHETIFIEASMRDKVIFRVPFSKYHNPNLPDKENSILSESEYRPSFVLMRGLGIPLCTGVITLDNERTDYLKTYEKTLTIGFHARKNSYQLLDAVVKPETFHNCGAFAGVLNFDDFVFNMLARATNLKTNLPIETPTRFKFKFLNEKSDLLTSSPIVGWSMPQRENDTFIAFHDKQWVRVGGKTIVNLNTEELVDQTFDVKDSLMYMLENDYRYRSDKNFTFVKTHDRVNYGYRILNINVPTSNDDPDVGKKLYGAMGIEYDIYDKVEMEGEHVNPASFIDGAHHFGVLKSKVILLDKKAVEEIISKLIDEESILKGNEEQDNGKTSIFDLGPKTRFDLHHFNFVAKDALNSYLAVNHEGEITDDFLDSLLKNWIITNLINILLGNKRKEVSETRALLKSLIISKEIYIPIFTPRLDEQVNAYLNPILQQKFDNNLNQVSILLNKGYEPNRFTYGEDLY